MIPTSMNKAKKFRPVKAVMVQDKEVGCISKYINPKLGRALRSTSFYEGLHILSPKKNYGAG